MLVLRDVIRGQDILSIPEVEDLALRGAAVGSARRSRGPHQTFDVGAQKEMLSFTH